MNRHSDWLKKLIEFIATRKHAPFEWGQHDCCLFAADAIVAITGTDLASEFRGKYSTAIGAKRALTRAGYSSIKQAITNLVGEPVTPLTIRRGDLILANINGMETVGIMYYQAVGPGKNRLMNIDAGAIICGWRVG